MAPAPTTQWRNNKENFVNKQQHQQKQWRQPTTRTTTRTTTKPPNQ